MPTFISPAGNPEVWNTKPDGYLTREEWKELHPVSEPEPLSLEQMVASRINEIVLVKEEKSAVMAFAGNRFDTDLKGKLNILGKLSEIERSEGGVDTVSWITHDNEMVELSAAEFCALAEAIPPYEEACVFTAFRHKKAIEALDDGEAVKRYDITQGWP